MTRVTHLGFEVRVDVELTERRRLLGPAEPGHRGRPRLEEKQQVWVRRTDSPLPDPVRA